MSILAFHAVARGLTFISNTLGSKGDELTEDNVSTKLTEAADSTDQMSVLEEKGKQGIAKTQGSDVFIVPLREDPSSPDDAKVGSARSNSGQVAGPPPTPPRLPPGLSLPRPLPAQCSLRWSCSTRASACCCSRTRSLSARGGSGCVVRE